MFGLLSLPKLLLTAAIIAGVWYGFKWLNQRQAQIKRDRNKKTTYSKNDEIDIEEMIPCRDCGAYVAKGSKHRCS
jgi:hypothetical protein|tara:strand:+ start:188 stop:412 length:225 start_codon:yes stop_codon:yes gene_type:complete